MNTSSQDEDEALDAEIFALLMEAIDEAPEENGKEAPAPARSQTKDAVRWGKKPTPASKK